MTYEVYIFYKCHVFYIGNSNPQENYKMDNTLIKNVDDLGVLLSADLKPSKHCTHVIKSANKLIGFIGRTFTFKSESTILRLCDSLVLLHLAYHVQFWSPY